MELYTHVLQKTGILKTFTVAKIVRKKEIEDLKKLIKDLASDENEYKTLLNEELAKLSNMHDKDNPIPGIIYNAKNDENRQKILAITKKISQNLNKAKFSKKELALIISGIITDLGLTQEDFINLKNDLEEEAKDYEDDEDDEEYED